MTDYETALAGFTPVQVPAIAQAEFAARIAGLAAAMQAQGIGAVWLDATASLTYYTGLALHASERLHGALVRADGSLTYVTPQFERPKLETLLRLPGEIAVWEEDEDPFALIASRATGRIALDPGMSFGFANRVMALPDLAVCSAQDLIAAQRCRKSAAELAILQAAMDASYRVHKAVHAGLRPGISTREVADFVNAAHRAMGMTPVFVAVQFGEATAYPHGVPYAQVLTPGDMVLVDLGGSLHGYQSDITRTYVFGTPTARQSQLWACEHRAQMAGFAAAGLPEATCASVDAAARGSLTADGFGPGYSVPGLPHRTGHGLGLELHEEPWIVAGNQTVLEPGMCFSIEPMLCVYGECGVRLEDIVYMTESGPVWFCPPSPSALIPFG
ncbi:M24 family metallopeptidase [Pseudotabrizicola alkalilacus]|uniref:Aminopeptidase P family protein n=1 Tax=Pseudotabrizicola alkalilacus TaxID=2305252 RepID=A0A411Z214_9RHOB|nr:Xaa-Pro peptidase family protein [Pseudotabrizicola alkalilacus]RGP37108.1 aminopeptidase P family protein [Pseudotabrizicola alkalilacus]